MYLYSPICLQVLNGEDITATLPFTGKICICTAFQ